MPVEKNGTLLDPVLDRDALEKWIEWFSLSFVYRCQAPEARDPDAVLLYPGHVVVRPLQIGLELELVDRRGHNGGP